MTGDRRSTICAALASFAASWALLGSGDGGGCERVYLAANAVRPEHGASEEYDSIGNTFVCVAGFHSGSAVVYAADDPNRVPFVVDRAAVDDARHAAISGTEPRESVAPVAPAVPGDDAGESGDAACGHVDLADYSGDRTAPPLPPLPASEPGREPASGPEHEPPHGKTPLPDAAVAEPATAEPPAGVPAVVYDPSAPLHPGLEELRSREALTVGRSVVGGSFTQPASVETLGTIDSSANAAETARRLELVDAAAARREAIRAAIRNDTDRLHRPYFNIPMSELDKRLKNAVNTLSSAADSLGSAIGGMDSSERGRFRGHFLAARDKALGARELIAETNARAARGPATLGGIFGSFDAPEGGNPLARSAELSELFAATGSDTDGLVDRLIEFNGLDRAARGAVTKDLRLVELQTLEFADGTRAQIPILHNGYIFGGSGSAMDCSSFVSAVLPADVRKGRFTTLDFRTMWVYRKTGTVPVPPQMKPARAKLIKSTSEAFNPVDLYAGQTLGIGDLLVFRLPWLPSGHVFIVRHYDKGTMTAKVIEAAQSAGTVRERDFPISLDPAGARKRYVRPGLFALRLRSTSNEGCTYEGGRAPSAVRSKGGLGRGVGY